MLREQGKTNEGKRKTHLHKNAREPHKSKIKILDIPPQA
jgi:hypothetical protein